MNYLIVSHYFSPFSKVGARRMTSLAVYLARCGHNVYVIKADDKDYGNNTIPKDGALSAVKEIRSIGYSSDNLAKNAIYREKYYKKEITRIMEKCRIDAVVMSAEPTEYLPLFRCVKSRDPSAVCIMDIRDPQGLDDHYGGNKLSFKRKLYILNNVRNEKLAAKYVDYISVVTEEAKRYYQKRYPGLKDRILCIKNGFDDITVNVDDVVNSRPDHHSDNIYLGIFGQYYLYGAEYSRYLVRLAQEYDKKKIIVKQFGVHDTEIENMFLEQGLTGRYEFVKSEGYSNDIRKLSLCDIGITSHHTRSSCGTKIYDYMLIDRPIIALNPYRDSELAEQVAQFENGYACTSYEEFRSAFIDIAENGKTELDSDKEKLLSNGRKHQFDILIDTIQRSVNRDGNVAAD